MENESLTDFRREKQNKQIMLGNKKSLGNGALKNLAKHHSNTPVGFENFHNSERHKHAFFFYSIY